MPPLAPADCLNTIISLANVATSENDGPSIDSPMIVPPAMQFVRLRANTAKPHMGLTSWKNAPAGRVRKPDVTIAKNYLKHEGIDALNRIVSAYLEFAELQAKNRRAIRRA